jgi:hypothetical protein
MNKVSVYAELVGSSTKALTQLTNVQKDSTIWLLIDNVILKNLVVQSSGFLLYGRHCERESLLLTKLIKRLEEQSAQRGRVSETIYERAPLCAS